MKLRNCIKCGKLFAPKTGEKICPVCRQEEESDFEKVKDFLWDNPKATIEKVHEETGVERDTIMKFVKEDRLIAEGIDVDWDHECERCGKAISHGRFCASCQRELINGLGGGSSAEEEKDDKAKKQDIKYRGKMYTSERIKDKDN